MEQERIYINRRRPYVTYVLIGLNLAMFAVELLMQALATLEARKEGRAEP